MALTLSRVPTWLDSGVTVCGRRVDVILPRKGNSDSNSARPVHLIITMIKRIRTRRLSIKKSLYAGAGVQAQDPSGPESLYTVTSTSSIIKG